MAHMVIGLAFSTLQQQTHPPRDATLLDGYASTHIVNSKHLLTDMVKAGTGDVVLVGDTAISVTHRGKRVMKNTLNRKVGRNATYLILHNVALVPGFHIN
ncbi:hypothetical protein GGI42DRAFT_358941 [Trichoderma sp. SZMC 28013]